MRTKFFKTSEKVGKMSWEGFASELKERHASKLKDLRDIQHQGEKISFQPYKNKASLALKSLRGLRLSGAGIITAQKHDDAAGKNRYSSVIDVIGPEPLKADEKFLERGKKVISDLMRAEGLKVPNWEEKKAKGGVIHLVTTAVSDINQRERIRSTNFSRLMHNFDNDIQLIHELSGKHEVFVDVNMRIRDGRLRLEVEPVNWDF